MIFGQKENGHNIKMGFDVTTVVIAVIISFIFLENISGVREGTIIALLGKMLFRLRLLKCYSR